MQRKLSKRETQVLELLKKGTPNIEICEILGLKPTSISTYKKRILLKTGVSSVIELINKKSESNTNLILKVANVEVFKGDVLIENFQGLQGCEIKFNRDLKTVKIVLV